MFGVGDAIGMRNACGILGDAAVVGEHRDRFNVLVTRCAKRSAARSRGREYSVLAASAHNVFRQCHLTGSCEETKGGAGIRSPPFRSPFGPAGSTGCRRTSYDPPYYWAAASVIGSTDTNTRPLVLLWNSTRPLINANKRVVPADADIAASMPFGAALARDNIAGHDFFAAENLDSQALAAGITAVARGSACFLVSHRSNLSSPLPIPDS